MQIDEAIADLARITAVLNRAKATVKTEDAQANDELSYVLRDEQLATDFAAAVNEVGRRMRSRNDCRPGLRIEADQRRAQDAKAEVSPEEDGQAYADSMRTQLRK